MDEINKPIRVAHIVGKMLGGGVESFLMNYYKNIDRTKIQFDFIIDSDSAVVPRKEIESLGGRIIEIPPYQKIFKYIKELKKVLKSNNYDIVHSHINTLSIFPLYCAWSCKVPIRIAHSHSTTNRKEWKKNMLKVILRPFSKVFANNYFACSEYAGRWLFGNKTFDEGKVTIIHNAIDTEKFRYNEDIRNKVRKDLGIEDKFVIGHIGRFTKSKNHDFLIKVFNEVHKENKKSVLILVGDGSLHSEIEEKVKKMNLSDAVIFLGTREDVNELMQAMDVFAFPSLYEGLGIALIEAQYSGLRCICSDEVPEEAKISDLIKSCSLNNINEWKNAIINQENIDRKKCSFEINNINYEIKREVIKLENKYLSMYKTL